MLRPTVLTPAGQDHIAGHVYKAGAYTPLDMLLNPFWLWLVELLPRWFAPNLVTFSGFLPMVLCYVLAWHCSPDFAEPVPRWLALLTAFSVFFYQTLDAMDGKQARRTGSSSPLGQLFDHGCDCLACLSHHSTATLVLMPGATWSCLLGLAALQTGFFMAQWQEYYTGVLDTSFGPVGVTEIQFSLMLLALSAGLLGPERLHALAAMELRVPWSGPPVQAGQLGCQAWAVFCAVLIASCMAKTMGHLLQQQPGGHRRLAQVPRALLDLLPVVALNVLLFLWEPLALQRSSRLICLLSGLLFFYYTAQMIVFSMARMPFPALQSTLLPYAGLVALSRLTDDRAAAVLGVALPLAAAGVGLVVLRWVLVVIWELKACLGICVFSLSRPGEEGAKRR